MQDYREDRTTSGKFFVLFITDQARRSRDEVYQALDAKGIQTKRYFYPSVHKQTIFHRIPMCMSTRLTHTMKARHEGLALPLYSHMTDGQLEMVCRHGKGLLG